MRRIMKSISFCWTICHRQLRVFRCFPHRSYAVTVGPRVSEVTNVTSLLEDSGGQDHHPQTLASPGLQPNDPSVHSLRPHVDPRNTSVILFPGQGSQYIGMSRSLLDYPNVQEMYRVASEILRYNLLDLCLHGPKDMLDMTAHCQTAIMVSSLAAVEKLKTDSPMVIENCVATAGFSVGEYTALVFAGALTFEDAVRLLKVRGEAMQKASDLVRSGMMTVFLRPGTKIKSACVAAREWCSQQNISSPECRVATYLFPDCKVIAGNKEALQFLEKNAFEFGIRKMKYIPVSGAFHSKLMYPAKNMLANALNCVDFKTPLIPVHSNVDGMYYTNCKDIKKKLAMQLCGPVKWQQTMNILFKRPEGTPLPDVYECGPGTTLRTILKMTNPKAYENCKNILA